MTLNIIKYPNRSLRQKCEIIKKPSDPVIGQLVLDMVKAMRAHKGLGLAAPQVGQNIALCIVEIENELFVLANPKIKKYSGPNIVMEEGCLSFPGKFLPIERPEKVKIKYQDLSGKKQIIRAKGLLARALQHEIDHLNGELFVDKA
jgi:peptide deformylase